MLPDLVTHGTLHHSEIVLGESLVEIRCDGFAVGTIRQVTNTHSAGRWVKSLHHALALFRRCDSVEPVTFSHCYDNDANAVVLVLHKRSTKFDSGHSVKNDNNYNY